MKKLLAAVCALGASVAFAGGTNLLCNASFAGDGLGGALNWSTRGGLEDTVTLLPGEGPGGANAVRVNVPKGCRFSQDNIRLVPGGEYRVGVWVRTSGLAKGAFRFMVWNDWWKDELIVADLPADTRGAWRKLEWRGKMIPGSKTKRYNFGFYANGGKKPGAFDVSAPFLEPLTEAARAGSEPAKAMQPVAGRVIPLEPRLFDVDAARPEMTFYYPYDTDQPIGECALEVSVDGGAPVRAPFAADRTARVRFGALAAGRHELALTLDGRTWRYPIAVVAHTPAAGRRLNNFVTELFRGEVTAGEIRYGNPRAGWIWCELTPTAGGRPLTEMRYRPAGAQTYVAPSDGTLRIHAVKPLVCSSAPTPATPFDWKRYLYGGDWFRRHQQPLFNTFFAYNATACDPARAAFEATGGRFGPEIGVSGADWANAAVLRARVTESATFLAGMDLELDEHAILNSRTAHYVTAEELWKVVDRPAAINVFWSDIMANVFFDKAGLASELAAIANTGRGRGRIYSETYFSALDGWTDAARQVEHYADVADSLRRISPMLPGSFLLCFGGYVEQGGWNNQSSPYADMKVLYDHFMHAFATDPRFAEVGGTGLTAQHHFDEEMMRWFLRAFRHYFLEGETEPLAPQYGFSYRPGHLENADFEKGLAGWTARPAAPGAIVATNVVGYGVRVQARKNVPDGYGDTVALFTRSAERPNELVGRLRGLEPGRLYGVTYCVNDPAELNDPGCVPMQLPFSVTVRGGEALPTHAYLRQWPPDRRPDGFRPGAKAKYALRNTGHFLFRATAAEAEITFSDWDSPKQGAAAAGRQTYLNGIRVRPYYAEGREEMIRPIILSRDARASAR